MSEIRHGLSEAERADRAIGATKESTIRNLQSAIDLALARSFLYRFVAHAYAYPTEEAWRWLSAPTVQAAFWSGVKSLTTAETLLRNRADELALKLRERTVEPFLQDYIAIFGHAARGSCPLNEIEYGDLKADPLFQPHRLADLAAYYRAFGLEIAEDASERPDHICIEFEFMSVLAAKEAFALEHQHDDGALRSCREAQQGFLREHLGRWTPAFGRRLARAAGNSALGSLAEFTVEFVETECRSFGVAPGSEDLLLRSLDEAGESLCASCGIRSLPPGATTTT